MARHSCSGSSDSRPPWIAAQAWLNRGAGHDGRHTIIGSGLDRHSWAAWASAAGQVEASSRPSVLVSSGLGEFVPFETEVIKDLSSKLADLSDGLSPAKRRLSTFKRSFEKLSRKAWGHGPSQRKGGKLL
jgi:hypothetical protein